MNLIVEGSAQISNGAIICFSILLISRLCGLLVSHNMNSSVTLKAIIVLFIVLMHRNIVNWYQRLCSGPTVSEQH